MASVELCVSELAVIAFTFMMQPGYGDVDEPLGTDSSSGSRGSFNTDKSHSNNSNRNRNSGDRASNSSRSSSNSRSLAQQKRSLNSNRHHSPAQNHRTQADDSAARSGTEAAAAESLGGGFNSDSSTVTSVATVQVPMVPEQEAEQQRHFFGVA